MDNPINIFVVGIAVADAGDNLTYQGNKARITVGKIKTKASKCPWDLAEAIGEMISTSLANNEKFIVGFDCNPRPYSIRDFFVTTEPLKNSQLFCNCHTLTPK